MNKKRDDLLPLSFLALRGLWKDVKKKEEDVSHTPSAGGNAPQSNKKGGTANDIKRD